MTPIDESTQMATPPSFLFSRTSRVRALPLWLPTCPSTGPPPASAFSCPGGRASNSSLLPYPKIATSAGFTSSSLPSGLAMYTPSWKDFEQLGEVPLLLAMSGDVARQHTRPGHLVALDDGVDHAVVVTPGAILKVGLDHSRPVALFQEPRQVSGRLRMQRRGRERKSQAASAAARAKRWL